MGNFWAVQAYAALYEDSFATASHTLCQWLQCFVQNVQSLKKLHGKWCSEVAIELT